jgi:hypothetical protein
MRRLIHPYLMRGHTAQRAAVLLIVGLLVVLVVAMVRGVGSIMS